MTLADLELSYIDSILLLAGLVAAMYILFQESDDSGESLVDEDEAAAIESLSTKMAVFWLLLGLVCLMISSKALVWGATEIARSFGISDLMIGLTIVAIGTSLPELAASVASALKGHHDIAIGNVIGSNIFNLLAVMPVPGLIATVAVEPMALYRDLPVMLALTLVLLVLFILNRRSGVMGRFSGSLLGLSYLGYLTTLFMMTSNG